MFFDTGNKTFPPPSNTMTLLFFHFNFEKDTKGACKGFNNKEGIQPLPILAKQISVKISADLESFVKFVKESKVATRIKAKINKLLMIF